MAVNNNVNITVNAKDLASKTLWKISKSFKGVEKSAKRMKIPFKQIWVWLAGVWVALWVAWKEFFKLADNIESTIWKADVVFWEYFDDVQKVADETAKAMWLTKNEYIKAAAWMQDLLIPMWFTRKEATKLTTDTVAMSGALAEWSAWQFEATEVADILAKAYLWEREQLKSLWIAISQEDVKQQMAIDTANWLTFATEQQAIAIATQTLIMQKSTDAQEAFANWAGSLTRIQSELRATIWNVKETIATALLPAFHEIINVIQPLVENVAKSTEAWFNNTENVSKLTNAFKVLIETFKIVAKIVWITIKTINVFWEALWLIAFRVFTALTQIWDAFVFMWGVISDVWDATKEVTMSTFDFIAGYVKWVIDWIVTIFTIAFDKIKWIFDKIMEFKDLIWDWVGNVIWGVTDAFWNTIDAIWETAGNIIWSDDSIDWTRAVGWTVQNWKTFLVWEKWPELFTPSTTGNITPNGQLGWGQAININIWGVTVNNEADEDRLMEKITSNLTRTLQLQKKGIS